MGGNTVNVVIVPGPLRAGLVACLIFIFALLTLVSIAASTPSLVPTACIPGALTDLQLNNTHALCTTYSGLLILDLTTPNPTPISFFPMLDDARGIAIRDNLAFLAPQDVGLRILDISDPANPQEIGTCPLPGGYGDLVLGPDHAYVGNQYNGLRVFDITDPTAPFEVYFLPLDHQVLDLELVGNTLYVAADVAGVRIIDVSNPAEPVLTETVDVHGNINAVKVRGGYAYVAAGLIGLKILDLTVMEIVQVGSVPLDFDLPYGTWCEDVDIVDNFAYATLSGNGLGIVDVSDPTAPVEVVACELTGRARRVAVRDGKAYSGCWNGGLRLVDVKDPYNPLPAGYYELLGEPGDVRVDDGLIYLAGGYAPAESKREVLRDSYTGGLYILDMANPTWPEIIGHSPVSITPSQIALGGSHAYLSCWLAGIQIMDVADPHAPYRVGEISGLGAYFYEVEVQGDVAYVSDEYSGIRTFDVSDPAVPVELGALDGEHWSSLEPCGNYLYATGYYDGLRVIDISDPSLLQVVGSIDLPNYANSVHVAGNRAYVANGHRGLSVIDITVPEAPVELGVFDTPDHAVSVVVTDNLAYVADRDAGIRVVDVHDPTAMYEIAHNELARPALSVTVDENYVYAACSLGGLFIFERFTTTSVDPSEQPHSLRLAQNFPNPFNPRTVIRYELPVSASVDLRVFDLAGRLVKTLTSSLRQAAGLHSLVWNGSDDTGRPVPSGIYFYRLRAGDFEVTKRMVIAR